MGVSGLEHTLERDPGLGVATGAGACHAVAVDEHDLLLRHAERWAIEHGRTMAPELLDEVLRLRSTHDGFAANRLPERSVTHLMLVRSGRSTRPAYQRTRHAETFGRSLRSTGRMAGGSAKPSFLIREVESAWRQMVKGVCRSGQHGTSSR